MDIISIVIILLGVIIAAAGIYIAIKNRGLRQVVITLIVEAEKAFEYGKNSEKFNYVYENFYARLPTLLKFLLTKDNIIMFIQKIFDEIKVALDYNNIDI